MKKISLKAARVNAGLSQKEAAEKLDISNKTLCSWENGKTYPDQPMIEKLCVLYSVTYDMIDFTA
jgi:DNA-binding XRE family transcriptional regulator